MGERTHAPDPTAAAARPPQTRCATRPRAHANARRSRRAVRPLGRPAGRRADDDDDDDDDDGGGGRGGMRWDVVGQCGKKKRET